MYAPEVAIMFRLLRGPGYFILNNWWTLVLRGALLVLFGIFALSWPHITALALLLLFGIYTVLDGVFLVFSAFLRGELARRRFPLILRGLAALLVGIIVLAWPGLSAVALLYVIAIWAIASGFFELLVALFLPSGSWIKTALLAAGFLSVLFGLLMLTHPEGGVTAVAWLIGLYAVVVGAVFVFLGITLRKLAKTLFY